MLARVQVNRLLEQIRGCEHDIDPPSIQRATDPRRQPSGRHRRARHRGRNLHQKIDITATCGVIDSRSEYANTRLGADDRGDLFTDDSHTISTESHAGIVAGEYGAVQRAAR